MNRRPVLASLALLLVAPAFADTVSAVWTGGATGSWTDSSWSGVTGFPNNSAGVEYVVTIPTGSPAPSVSLDSAPDLALSGLTLGSAARLGQNTGVRTLDLFLASDPFSIGGAFINSGVLDAAGGSLTLRNAFIDNTSGVLRASGGVLTLDVVDLAGGALEIGTGGVLSLTGIDVSLAGVQILNSGSVSVESAASPNLSGSVVNNGSFALEDSAWLVLLGDTTFSGNGTLFIRNGNIDRMGSSEQLINQSVISGSGTVSTAVVNTGTIVATGNYGLQGELLYFGQRLDNAGGVLRVSSDSRLELFDLAQFVPDAGIGPGTLTGGTYEVAGTLTLDLASITNNQAVIALSGAGARIDDGINDALAGLASNSGEIRLSNGAAINTAFDFANSGTVRIDDAASGMTVAGQYRQDSGSTRVDGTLGASSVDVTGGTLSGSGSLDGDLSLSSGGIFTVAIDAILGTNDRFFVDGGVTLDGLIRILLNGDPSAGARFEWLAFSGALSGQWIYDLPSLPAGLAWQEERGSNYLALLVDYGTGPQSETPEPSAGWLIGVPLVALAAFALRRKR